MVSHPDRSTSLTVRGPSSVVSRSSLSRTRRYNRSHVGGASYLPQNEFPIFSHSGDVEIVVAVAGHTNRYLLHRHTLTRCSGFFEVSTSEEWSRGQQIRPPDAEGPPSTEVARAWGSGADGGATSQVDGSPPAVKRRWRYELDPGTSESDVPMLVQRDDAAAGGFSSSSSGGGGGVGVSLFGGPPGPPPPPPAASSLLRSKTAPQGTSFFRSVANLSLAAPHGAPALSQADEDLLRDYDNLFRIFYNYPPTLDGVNIADAYVQCKSLLTLADLYDALAVVGPRVDHHLLQFQSRLWKQIAKYPISYLRLGYLARSKIIFQEALIHVVGQWPVGERSLRAALPAYVMDIIADKVEDLEEMVARVDGRLFRLTLLTSKGERVTPANSYLDWLVVSLFRQWLADNMSAAPPPVAVTVPLPPPPHDRHRNTTHHHHRDARGSTNGNGHPAPPESNAASESGYSSLAQQTLPLSSIGRTYRALGSPNNAAYLGHDECKRFLKLTAELYSRDNLRRFEKRLDEMKAMARELVRPLMGSGLELEGSGGGSGRLAESIDYLTCTRVGDGDLPWLEPEERG